MEAELDFLCIISANDSIPYDSRLTRFGSCNQVAVNM